MQETCTRRTGRPAGARLGFVSRRIYVLTYGTYGTYGTYSWVVTEMPMTEARDHLADVVNRVAYSGESTYLTRRGRRLAAIVPVELLEAIEALEDRIDVEAAEESYAEVGENITLDQMRDELRLPRTAP